VTKGNHCINQKVVCSLVVRNIPILHYSNTPLLRAQGFEDEDEDENEARRVWSTSHEKSA
jgi:hypothetical protein